jgi:antitoxin component YwqK of YwqJK toxin-antitoxin module
MTQNNTINTVEVTKEYYSSGALMCETPYVNDKEHGIEKWYYESGALEREVPYVNGRRNGIVKAYYESGALWWEIPLVNGKMHGIKKGYAKDNSNIDRLTLYNSGREVAIVVSNI